MTMTTTLLPQAETTTLAPYRSERIAAIVARYEKEHGTRLFRVRYLGWKTALIRAESVEMRNLAATLRACA
jgi:hypothetical protein